MKRLASLFVLLPLLAQQPSRPSDVLAHPAQYTGKQVQWLGREIRTSRIPRGAPEINGRLFVMVDPQGGDLPGQLFAVDGVATETDAAKRLNRTRGDKNIRRVRGTITGVGDMYQDDRTGPILISVTLDAP